MDTLATCAEAFPLVLLHNLSACSGYRIHIFSAIRIIVEARITRTRNKNISNIGTIALLMLEVRMLMNRTLELQGWFLGAALSGPLVGFRRRHEDLGRTCTWHCLSWPNVKLFQISAFRCFACARSPDVTFLFRQPFPFGRDAGVCAGQGEEGASPG